VTFTAVVAPNGTSATPTGTVVFTIDGFPQAPVPLVVHNGRDEANLSIASLATGAHSIEAAYRGDSSFAPSAVASPLVQVINALLPRTVNGPKVLSVKRYGIHMHPTVLEVSFDQALDLNSAVNLENYRITDPAGRAIAVRSAAYDSATHTVT